ncbi:hypothetical protein KC343_g16 [Hortaea werneckii]|nr:hypothetical protein KC317_g16 [Hortaea werneckii]KAI7628685.1 hypothetical protein KC346_g16 [Hortaea werneckii]KAI7638459.1 hypothetical protein KC343_g16 [Hortaea werneckii]
MPTVLREVQIIAAVLSQIERLCPVHEPKRSNQSAVRHAQPGFCAIRHELLHIARKSAHYQTEDPVAPALGRVKGDHRPKP